MAIEKIKILGAVLELPAKQHCQFSSFGPTSEVNGLDWQCCLAGSSKTAPRIFIFSIALDAEYLSYVKFIATRVPTFFGYTISVLASVYSLTVFGQYQVHSIIVDVKNGHLLCVGEEILKVSLYVGLTQVSINQTGHWSRTWRLFSHLKIQNNTYISLTFTSYNRLFYLFTNIFTILR